MKKLLLQVLMCVAVFPLTAKESYKILYINTPSITINGAKCGVGDTFDENYAIEWTSDRQAMKVAALSSGRQMVLSARNFSGDGKTILDYLTGSARLSTRPGAALSVVDLRNRLSDTHYLLDYVDFPAVFPSDDAHVYFLTYERDGETINKMLRCVDGSVIIDWDIYTVDGSSAKPVPMVVTVNYYDTAKGEITEITDSMTIIPLDPSLDE